jgi:hypothetical protein
VLVKLDGSVNVVVLPAGTTKELLTIAQEAIFDPQTQIASMTIVTSHKPAELSIVSAPACADADLLPNNSTNKNDANSAFFMCLYFRDELIH